jgi:SAM-dependent methyltransferase
MGSSEGLGTETEHDEQRRRWNDAAEEYGTVLGSAAPDDAVACLAELAGPHGTALELGAGIGRVAIPLAARLRRVDALDISDRMLERLTDLAPSNVHAIHGSMDAIPAQDCSYDLIYCINSSFYYLLTQQAQITCLREARRCLQPGGTLLPECFNPLTSVLVVGQHTHPRRALAIRGLTEDSISLSINRTNLTTQQTLTQELTVDRAGTRFSPLVNRFCWPSELDLMAQIADLTVIERVSDWTRRRSYSADQDFNHITVLRKDS